MKAAILIREEPHYRRDAFVAGLRAVGYDILPTNAPSAPCLHSADLLVVWGLGSGHHLCAEYVRNRGGKVIVVENGYIGNDENGHQLYAMARDGHNGAGWFPVTDEDRWSRLGIELKPWRESGDHIVVFGQRGIGSPEMRSPPNWHRNVAVELKKYTKRRIVVSEHPGAPACSDSVVAHTRELLEGAHAAVVWASARGIRALVEGVPVIYMAPRWIASAGATWFIHMADGPAYGDPSRKSALREIAHAQFTLAEITEGEPFRRLLQ